MFFLILPFSFECPFPGSFMDMRKPTKALTAGIPRSWSARRIASWASLLAAGVLLLSCQNATNINTLKVKANGVVYGVAFVDENGNQVYDTGDQPLKNVTVLLEASSGGAAVQQAATDTLGDYRMLDVPAGSYAVTLSPGLFGDSVGPVGDSLKAVTLQGGDTTRVDYGVSFPTLTIAEVRALPAGRPVFTSGIALNPNLSYGDARLHIQGDSTYLRAINVARATVLTGDSVRLQGHTASDNGEPVLDNVTPYVLVSAARIPVPLDVGTGEAAGANGGRLDAALVRVRNADILDTATVNGNFQFHIDDGSGTLEVVVPAFLQLNTSGIMPDSILRVSQAVGLLVPSKSVSGQVSWQLYPRGGTDLVFQVKQIDVGVGMVIVPTVATYGDTVRITVVATNAATSGYVNAIGVQIADTIPTGLGLVSASATRGSYDQATHLWSIDTLKTGGADTLRLTTTVTTSILGTLTDRAYFTGIPHEYDTNPSNNTASGSVTIQ